MGGDKCARVVVVSREDADTVTDCLDHVAGQVGPGIEVVLVDLDSSDGTAEVAIRHPVVDRVAVVHRGDLAAAMGPASTPAARLLLLRASTRPEPGCISAGLTALESAPVVLGGSGDLVPLALDLERLGPVRILDGVRTVDDLRARASAAGAATVVAPDLRTSAAEAKPPVIGPLPVAALRRAAPPWLGTLSVVLCTRDRSDQLRRCLRSLAALADDDHEIVVVDNHDRPTVRTEDLPLRARVIHEPRRGLDIARNRGAAEAVGDVIAYIDDDCEADPGWIIALRAAFADPVVDLVTGRVRPATLARPTQRWFECHFGFDRGVEPRRFTPWDDRPWFPLWTGPMGTGCNMAVRRSALEAVGGFDELLDVGTLVGGAGDLDFYSRLIEGGSVAEYAPDALVWHHHREREDELARQFTGYGQAAGGYVAKVVLDRPGRRVAALRWYGHFFSRRLAVARAIRRGEHLLPMRFLLLELRGHISGPPRYLLSRARRRWQR